MHRHVMTLTAFTAALAVGPSLPASAAAKPRASLALSTTSAEAGQRVALTYLSSHVPAGAHVELQRTVGTARTWKNVARLHSGSGSSQTSVIPQGKTGYRVVVVSRRGAILAASSRTVIGYASVALETLRGHGTDTVKVGSGLFRYASEDEEINSSGIDFKEAGSTCRSVALQVVTEPYFSGPLDPVVIAVASESADPIDVTVPVDTVTSLAGPVAGDWEVDVPTGSTTYNLYANGTADCWTPTGVLPSSGTF